MSNPSTLAEAEAAFLERYPWCTAPRSIEDVRLRAAYLNGWADALRLQGLQTEMELVPVRGRGGAE